MLGGPVRFEVLREHDANQFPCGDASISRSFFDPLQELGSEADGECNLCHGTSLQNLSAYTPYTPMNPDT